MKFALTLATTFFAFASPVAMSAQVPTDIPGLSIAQPSLWLCYRDVRDANDNPVYNANGLPLRSRLALSEGHDAQLNAVYVAQIITNEVGATASALDLDNSMTFTSSSLQTASAPAGGLPLQIFSAQEGTNALPQTVRAVSAPKVRQGSIQAVVTPQANRRGTAQLAAEWMEYRVRPSAGVDSQGRALFELTKLSLSIGSLDCGSPL